MKKIVTASLACTLGIVLLATLGVVMQSQKTSAANSADWQAGRIIDDFIFTNSDSMSVQDIQNFLNSKIGTCDVWGTGTATEYGYSGTRAQYAAANGWPGPPYTCLNMYYEVPKTAPSADLPANNYSTPSTIPSGAQSAAWMIKDAAARYQISPQVLLVKIATESAGPLTSDNWPLFSQYRYAMGAHCPDSGPGGSANCDPNYAGFSIQIYEAAKLLRSYLDNMDQPWWGCIENNVKVQCAGNRETGGDPGGGYKVPNATNFILWTVSARGCGGQNIFIENKATAALYTYTPYQPNQASLNNMYGTGDNCSSYGNRNFWRVFTDWFDSTTVPRSNVYIPDGTYTLKNPVSGRVIDVANGSTADGARTWIYTQNNTNAQNWRITRESDGFYTIMNIASGKYLDVTGGSVASGVKIQVWTGNGGCAQRWSAVNVSGGISLINKCSGRALDIAGGGTADTTPLQTYTRNATAAQTWRLTATSAPSIANGFYRIDSTSGFSLDIEDGSTARGASARIYTSSDIDAQYWQVTRTSDGFYTIRNPLGGKYLDVVNEGKTDGVRVQTWDGHDTCAQKWYFQKNQDTSYTLLSACSGLALDVTGGAINTSGTNVQIWTSNSTAAQHWSPVPLDKIPDATYGLTSVGGVALDVVGGQSVDGASIQIWSRNRTSAQKWQFISSEGGSYAIKNTGSGKYLDVAGGSMSPGTRVQLWSGNTTCAQRWKIIDNGNSTYRIQPMCTTGVALDITGGRLNAVGTKVQIWTANSSEAQMWMFVAP